MHKRPLVVRAVDVGYGHIKFTDGRDTTGNIRTDSIPSQSPGTKPAMHNKIGVMKQRDTSVIPVGGHYYEVGRDVHLALDGYQETEVLDEAFCLSDAYAARLFGALNYMSLPDGVIDVLVLGLPMNTFRKHQAELEQRFNGEHVINSRGDSISVKHCHVYPQPLGSYMSYLVVAQQKLQGQTPLALSVDPGYNTVDWFLCQGMSANDERSGAVHRGMGGVMRAIAADIIKVHRLDASPGQLVRAIDRSLTMGSKFTIYGKEFDLAGHMAAGNSIIQEAAQSVKNSVGTGHDIDVILLTGGGGSLYSKAIQEKFPHHEVIALDSPALANVRGFHVIGEMMAKSLSQALKLDEAVAVPA